MKYPVRFLPFRDELITSWLIRLAWANGRKVQRLSYELVPTRSASLWHEDVDWRGHQILFGALERYFDVSKELLTQHTLQHLLARSANQVDEQGLCQSRWVVSGKKHYSASSSSGVVVCPLCLAEDKQPYVRKMWKLSWYTLCNLHKVEVIDRCEKCSKFIDYQFFDHGRKHSQSLFQGSIVRCRHCGFDLRSSNHKYLVKADKGLLVLQNMITLIFNGRRINNPVAQSPLSHAFFDLLRHLLKTAQGTRNLHNLLAHVDSRWGIGMVDTPSNESFDFDLLALDRRKQLLIRAAYLMRHFPYYLVSLSGRYSVTSSYWLNYNKDLPYFFCNEIIRFLDYSWYAPSVVEKNSVKHFLFRNGFPVHFYNVRRWLGRWYPDTNSMRSARKRDGYDF